MPYGLLPSLTRRALRASLSMLLDASTCSALETQRGRDQPLCPGKEAHGLGTEFFEKERASVLLPAPHGREFLEQRRAG